MTPLLFNLYLRELGLKIEGCQEGFKYTAVNSNGKLSTRDLIDLMYEDDVCLFAESAESLQRICDNVSAVIDEYGMKVSEIKSKVVCINGVSENRKLKIGRTDIGETEECKYLGGRVKYSQNCGLKYGR